jgi:hypothetical protein
LNATRSARAWPESRAASEVRTLALVAAFIPMKPAAVDERAPNRKAPAVSGPIAHQSRTPTISTKTASTEYSRFRNAMAPASIWSARSRMISLPAGCLRSQP